MAAHFNHAGASIPPASVVERIVTHLRLEAELGGYEAAEAVDVERQQVDVELAALIGAAPTDVVAVESATRAWEMALWSLALSRGWGGADRVVVDQFAYASSWATLLRLRSALGVEVVVADACDDGSIDVERLDEVVDDRTRLVLVTHVPTHVGTVSDVAAVGRRLAGHGIVYAVDASQSLGQLPFDVAAIGCQVAFAPGRKFLRAPRGTGLLHLDGALAETLEPLSVDLTSATSLDAGGYRLQPGAGRFEGFERSVALHLGLGEAARIARAIGIDEITRGVADRTRAVVERLSATPSVRLVASGDLAGIVSFTHDRLDPDEVRRILGRHGVSVWVNVSGGSPVDVDRRASAPSVRVSPHHVTTDDEIEVFAAALSALS